MTENIKEVRFDKYCITCKHFDPETMFNPDIGTYNTKDGWSGLDVREERVPCCYCLEEGAREGTEVPVEWEAK